MSTLVLASASSSRQALLKAAGVEFRALPASLNESALMDDLIAKGSKAETIATVLAEQKAIAVSRRRPGEIVLGGDSVLELGADILGKSGDMEALRVLLGKLSGKTHYLVSAAAMARDGRTFWQHVNRVRMTVRTLSDTFIDTYLAEEGEKLLGSVGGYHFEGRGVQLFESVAGDYFSILGLPLLPVLAALRTEGLLEK